MSFGGLQIDRTSGRFLFCLGPRLMADATGDPPRPRRMPSLAKTLSIGDELRVLIVEDEFFVAWELQTIVEELQVRSCAIAASPEQALDLAIETKANLLLMDINLGGPTDGIEVARRIKEHQDAAAIFITAYGNPAVAQRVAAVLPGAPILSKPVSANDLRIVIERILRKPKPG